MKKKFIIVGILLCVLSACTASQHNKPTATTVTTSAPSSLSDEMVWIELSSKEHRIEAQQGLNYLSYEYGISKDGCEVYFGQLDFNNNGTSDWILYCRGDNWKGIYHDGSLHVLFRDGNGITGHQSTVPEKLLYSGEHSEMAISITKRSVQALEPTLIDTVQYLELRQVTDTAQYKYLFSFLGEELESIAKTDIYVTEHDINHDGRKDQIIYATGILWGGSGGLGSLSIKLAEANTLIHIATVTLIQKEQNWLLPILVNEDTYDSLILGDNIWSWNGERWKTSALS